MQKNIVYSLIKFLQEVEQDMNMTIQKFAFEAKDMKVWVINKIESKDGFVLRTEDKNYFYLDFTKQNLVLSALGSSDIIELMRINLNDESIFDAVTEKMKQFLKENEK